MSRAQGQWGNPAELWHNPGPVITLELQHPQEMENGRFHLATIAASIVLAFSLPASGFGKQV